MAESEEYVSLPRRLIAFGMCRLPTRVHLDTFLVDRLLWTSTHARTHARTLRRRMHGLIRHQTAPSGKELKEEKELDFSIPPKLLQNIPLYIRRYATQLRKFKLRVRRRQYKQSR
jgi:hypothetical protein